MSQRDVALFEVLKLKNRSALFLLSYDGASLGRSYNPLVSSPFSMHLSFFFFLLSVLSYRERQSPFLLTVRHFLYPGSFPSSFRHRRPTWPSRDDKLLTDSFFFYRLFIIIILELKTFSFANVDGALCQKGAALSEDTKGTLKNRRKRAI